MTEQQQQQPQGPPQVKCEGCSSANVFDVPIADPKTNTTKHVRRAGTAAISAGPIDPNSSFAELGVSCDDDESTVQKLGSNVVAIVPGDDGRDACCALGVFGCGL